MTGLKPRMPAIRPLRLDPVAVDAMRAELPEVAEHVVAAVIDEVPSYTDAFSGPMGETIRDAVKVALGGFLSLAGGRHGSDPRTPAAPAVEGAYQLGRGEARSGRSTEALLAAYRIGARVSWRQLSTAAVASGMPPDTVASFAELVFAYIDELSAASVAGHADELDTTGRVRQRLLDRLAHQLLAGASEATVSGSAERADWSPPTTLTALIVPEAQVRPVLSALSPRTLQAADLPDLDEGALLLVPDAHGRGRAEVLRAIASRGAVAGPPRPWLEVRASYDRALRARSLGLTGDTDAHLAELVLRADAAALADLKAEALAPLSGLRPASADKLADTLRAWLLHHGRRDEIAAALFVHPQTVRYRMSQLRELYGDRLEDPDSVLTLTIALAMRDNREK
jgi:hypothetical protein